METNPAIPPMETNPAVPPMETDPTVPLVNNDTIAGGPRDRLPEAAGSPASGFVAAIGPFC